MVGWICQPCRFPTITRCTDDGPIFWIRSAAHLGYVGFGPEGSPPTPQAWKSAPVVRHLRGPEYLEAIASGLGDSPEKLLELRLLAWRDANGDIRDRSQRHVRTSRSDFPIGSAARANLESLVAMLDASILHQALLKAEGLRELGRFDEAKRAIDASNFTTPYRANALKIRGAAVEKDARVMRLE